MTGKADCRLLTPVGFDWTGPQFGPDAVVAGIGSCFAVNLLNRLFALGMRGSANPTGIVYNAVSMAEALEAAAAGRVFSAGDFFACAGVYHSRLHHGSFSHSDPVVAANAANEAMTAFSAALRNAEMVVLTPSSSVVYVDRESGAVFANCHRLPQSRFERRLLGVAENRAALDRAVAAVRTLNHNATIVFTVSPVRHYPGDLVLNSRSKASLLTAVHETVEAVPGSVYFPSYEIVNDELRDYRFFGEDMLHPSPLTEKIICSRFTAAFFTPAARAAMDNCDKALRAAAHRPRFND